METLEKIYPIWSLLPKAVTILLFGISTEMTLPRAELAFQLSLATFEVSLFRFFQNLDHQPPKEFDLVHRHHQNLGKAKRMSASKFINV